MKKICPIVVIISLLLIGCRTQYVPVETVRTEYINKTDTFIRRDSVYYKDSVIIEKNGDTITIQKTKTVYKDRWMYKNSVDTVIKVDSIQVPYPVERKLSLWEQTKMNAGGIAILIVFVFIVIILLRWLVKIRSKTRLFS